MCLLLTLVAASCASSGAGNDATRIAFIQDLSAPDADEHVQPAFQAAELAVAMQAPGGGPVELVPFDLAEDPAAIEHIASDPSFVAAIAGPGADGAAVAEAGVPTVAVSTAGPTPGRGSWRRFVAQMDVLADVLAAELAGTAPCILSEEPSPDELAGILADRLDVPAATLETDEVPSSVGPNACDAVAWVGSPDPGAELAGVLPGETTFVGGDRLLDPDFLDAGSAADGARAVCACADVWTSTDPGTMRFIQDYQSEFGTAPGPYAVESWDAARAILALLVHGSGRADVAAALGGLEAFDGLVTAYRFAPNGELTDPMGSVAVSEVRLGRWVRVEPAG
jgi:branched-chain amino acid transport system substrate-binding protein